MSDSLTTSSRVFFEETKLKLFLSLFAGSCAVCLLAFTSIAGGVSSSAEQLSGAPLANRVDDYQNALNALSAGAGFGAFFYICAFVMFTSASIMISPFFCGSSNEKKTLATPLEVEATDRDSVASAVPYIGQAYASQETVKGRYPE
jgi:hypothetical protein